jgi:post-segregation antitoxin (ccd killing protein)
VSNPSAGRGSIAGTTEKLAISIPDELAEDARRAVTIGQAASVSGYVATAMEHYRARKTLDEWLDDVDAELGPPSPEASAWARRLLDYDEAATV